MPKFYSASTNGFYDSEINAGSIPNDAKQISYEQWAFLLSEQSNNKIIQANANGFPEAVEIVITNQEKIDLANLKILQILKTTAWTQASDETNINQLAWATYRQEVRDVILQPGYPDNIVWPVAP